MNIITKGWTHALLSTIMYKRIEIMQVKHNIMEKVVFLNMFKFKTSEQIS